MASALSTMDSKKALAAVKLRTIEAYLQINSVPPELRSHILEFYEYLCADSPVAPLARVRVPRAYALAPLRVGSHPLPPPFPEGANLPGMPQPPPPHPRQRRRL